ncbi:MAG: hypothetical protein HQ503_07400 [Rhodospirillales bacterium]|nr:hypothetical protein [Rhodospirillales bacterium]
MRKPNKSLWISAASAAAVGLFGLAPANAGFYDGKTVTVIINAGAGGGQTRSGQAFMSFMQKHLGKGTNMVIKNLPGAGGIRGMNFMTEKAKPDGMTIMWGSGNHMGPLLKMPGTRYEISDFKIIGAGESSFVSIMRTDTKPGIKKPGDIMNVQGLIVGGRAPNSALDIFARMPLEILGIKYRYVPGYKAQPKLKAALLAKEINYLTTGHQGYRAFYENTNLKDGSGIALYYHSALDRNGKPKRLPYYPDSLPHFLDLYKAVKGGTPSGPAWEAYKWVSTYVTRPQLTLAPPKTPAALVSELRRAYGETVKDPAFKAAYKKQFTDFPNYIVGKDAEWLINTYRNISPAGIEGLKRLVAKKKKKK